MKLRWPWVSRKKHETEIAALGENIKELKKTINIERTANANAVSRIRREYEAEIREKIEPVVKKFLQIRVFDDYARFDRYALQVRMDTNWVESCLIHGNSQREIEHISSVIAQQVSYELETILRSRNFERANT